MANQTFPQPKINILGIKKEKGFYHLTSTNVACHFPSGPTGSAWQCISKYRCLEVDMVTKIVQWNSFMVRKCFALCNQAFRMTFTMVL